jgi:hypothetical protein
MTVIRPNSISGITSITAQGDTISLFRSDGTTVGALNLNVNASSGVSTFANLVVTGNVSIAGTLTYEDVTNVDSIGIVTARTGIQVLAGGINAVGVVTATSFSGDVSTNAIVNSGITTTATLVVTGVGTFGTSVGVATASPKSALDLSQKTDAIALPQGTTAQRPSGNSPYIRYNTTNSALEFYNGTDWVEIISDYFPSGSVILG